MKNKIINSHFNCRCSCWWSKNNSYGFIPDSECPVHGDAVKETIKKKKEVVK